MEPETAQTESGYTLTAEERTVLLQLNQAVGARKVAIHDLNAQLELAMKERDAAERLFAGAFAMLANSHGMPQGRLAADFTRIDEEKQT